MIATRRFPTLPVASFGVLLLAIYTTMLLISGSHLFAGNPDLGAFAITFDLTVTVPVLFYLLVVRNTVLHWITIAPVFLLSLLGASLVLPPENQRYLNLLEHLVVPAELLLFGFLGVKAVRDVRRARAQRLPGSGSHDFVERLQATLRQALPAKFAADVVAHEVAFLYYALFSWRDKPDVGEGEIAFSYHQKNGYGGILVAITLVAAVEMVVVHLLVASWSPTVAWILFAVSVYGIVWLLGYAQAIRLRPILLSSKVLHVRIGLLWSVQIPLASIASVQPAKSIPETRSTPGYLHAVTVGNPQWVIELGEPVEVHGLYGYTKKNVQQIGIAVDDRARFGAELERRLTFAGRGLS
ncbi:hypothetical protein BH20GEM3_BH20GEM3_15370 [soil metagenome]